MKSLILKTLLLTIVSSNVFADCRYTFVKLDDFTPKSLLKYNELDNVPGFKFRELVSGDFHKKAMIKKGKDIYNASEELQTQRVMTSTNEAFSSFAEIPSEQEYVTMALNDFLGQVKELQKNKSIYIKQALRELKQDGLRQAMLNKSQKKSLVFWRNEIESKLGSLISNFPAELKESIEGVEIAYKSFLKETTNKIDGIGSTTKTNNLKINQLVQDSKITYMEELTQMNVIKQYSIDSTKEYQEINEIWSELQTYVSKNQDKAFEPALNFLDNLDRHFANMDQSLIKNDPIFKIREELFASMKNRFGIEKINIERGKTKFNPDIHEALSVVEQEGTPAGVISTVIQNGYQKPGKVLRYPKVVVTK